MWRTRSCWRPSGSRSTTWNTAVSRLLQSLRPVVELLLPVHGQVALQERPLLALDAPELLPAVQAGGRVVGDGDGDDEEQQDQERAPVHRHRLDELVVLRRPLGGGVLQLQPGD